MAWTYDSANLTSTTSTEASLAQARLYSGLNDTTDQRVDDAEMAYFVTQEITVRGAAAAALEHLAAQAASLADKEVGDLALKLSQRSEAYAKRAAEIRELEGLLDVGSPIIGGISRSRKRTVEADTDLVSPAFKTDMLRHPWTIGDGNDLTDEEQP